MVVCRPSICIVRIRPTYPLGLGARRFPAHEPASSDRPVGLRIFVVCAFVSACDRSEGDEIANRFVYEFPCCEHDFFPLPFLGKPGVEISRLSIRNKEIALGNVEGGKKRPTRSGGRNFGLPHSRDRVLATYKQIEIRRTSRGRMGRPIEKAETRTVEAIDRSIERRRR